ncbi:EAL domain-containing response regulator (plasmid) [Pseudoalteromonas xiamenensis]|uniref:EAL domain-containing response regulator n=1 Tax=Pseudoalteromonas xiamenensis TaxID=882626 RepID=UPI0027E3CD15|nr:EAL domain-containing response regulator [Pseudoalteromonas xiamenensis]WMN61613.1 EAL domain-containing response regulator [Pseudoalteromonas xiamenensis]
MQNAINSILVVDDQQVVRHTLCLCLRNIGYSDVAQAENGSEAKVCLNKHAFDLIFLDLNMPVEDGFSVLKYLAAVDFKGLVVLISSEDEALLESTTTLARQYKLEILGCVQKPLSIGVLKELLARGSEYIQLKHNRFVDEMSKEQIVSLLDNNLHCAYFQPQIDLSTHQLKGLEVLARFKNVNGQLVFPDSFIPTIEQDAGLMMRFTRAIICHAFEQIMRFGHFMDELTIALNISGKVLNDDDFPAWLKEQVEMAGLTPCRVICELTETALNDDPNALSTQMLRLRMMGFRLSIDDFGTGYSSMEQLHRLPFHELKIDKHFVFNCLSNPKSAAIVEQSIKLATALNMEVVAEGIECLNTEMYLRSLGCHVGQGFYYSKAVEMDALLAMWKPTQRASSEV